MEELWIALGKVGGLAAVGGLIDLGMRRKEKERLKHWMIVLWDRFDSIKWSNFGQEEAKAAIRIIDRIAGRRLLSVRRWVFTLGVAAGASLLSIAWVSYLISSNLPHLKLNVPRAILGTLEYSFGLTYMAETVVAFALSISVTRAIATFVARKAKGPLLNALFFSALLLAHIILFFVWTTTMVPFFVAVGEHLVAYIVDENYSSSLIEALRGEVGTMRLRLSQWDLLSVWPSGTLFQEVTPGPTNFMGTLRYKDSVFTNVIEDAFQTTFSRILDLVSNGARILFAVVFLSSFVFRPLVRAPISRLWAGVVESDRPIFATLFGAAGAIVVLIQALTR